ncbi:MAG: toprim domain-containing protein [Caldilineaceae bacterium SB0668_bin_21]|nr:toprim domain-containing protein [Caldilineaceae bacterium SB0668_bin_21]MYC22879.1 toprim domain-containing protein [Caldilineaceae bacterium SB0662_bin_25]
MLTHSTHNRISLATAAEVAARLPGTRREGDHYRTRGYCHGSGDEPNSGSLLFSDPEKSGASLHVFCFKCSPSTPAEYDAIRHTLQKATGLHLCRCRACWEARRTGQPPGGATTRSAAPKRSTPATTRSAPQCPRNAVIVPQWGAHQLPQDDAGGRSHASPCPLCRQPDALIAWTLTDHPFPYAGLSLRCQCTASYDQLHKHVAAQVSAKGRQWRQDAVYILADGRARPRTRIDPDKRIFWNGQKGASVRGRQPLSWNHPRRGQPRDGPHVLLVEGEKAAAAAVSAGIDGSHAVYSVGDTAGFHVSDFTQFDGREITLWPDADVAGIEAAVHAARRLAPLARRLLLVDTMSLPNKGDAADLNPRTIHARIRFAKEIAE